MIGLGTWKFDLKTMIFTGEVRLEVFDNAGQYGLRILQPAMETPQITVKELKETDDTVKAVISTALVPHADLTLVATFAGDRVEGYVKVPFIGKVPLKGERV
ncbi:MAG: hypothetical protein IJK64_11700 [Clostridia bacterium]|nr:hypothetical protein [Clostridia bacterium]